MDNDVRIVIDAGHGGTDPGAVGNGYQEKDLNLKISTYMYDRFRELGIPVKIIRSTDETISPKARTQRILDAYGNDPNVIVISNHINAGGGEGAEVLFALRNEDDLARLILEGIGSQGQKIRRYYQRKLPSNPTKDYNFIFRDTGVTEPVLIEYGFIDNAADINRVANNYEKYAEAVVKAITDYKNLPYTFPGGTGETNLYTVQAGDSLWSISRRFGTTVNEIKQLNGLTSDLLKIGQNLLITSKQPETNQDGIYTVKPGDTLYSIANKYNTTVDEIKILNNITSNILSIGTQLLVPNFNDDNEQFTYTTKAGDTLYGIANKYGTTVNAIKNLNNLTSDILTIGTQLEIPQEVSNNELIMYTVQAGDSLWRISRNFNTTVDDIRRLNNLTSDILSIGQTLIIPA